MVACVNTFHCQTCHIIWIHYVLLTHSSVDAVDGPLGCLHLLTIMNTEHFCCGPLFAGFGVDVRFHLSRVYTERWNC